MFDQVFANLQKATESSVKMQQEMLQKWAESLPQAMTSLPSSTTDTFGEWRKQWEETAKEMLKKQKHLVDENYQAGIQALDDIFAASGAKDPQEYQQKVTELYRKSFESLQQLSEAQVSEFKAAVEKCSELLATSSK